MSGDKERRINRKLKKPIQKTTIKMQLSKKKIALPIQKEVQYKKNKIKTS